MENDNKQSDREPMPSSMEAWKPAILFFCFIILLVAVIAGAAALIDISIYGL